MKIIRVDNFARETESDSLVTENVNDYYGPKIVKFLNDTLSGDHSSAFFRLVPDDHKLYESEP